MDKSSYLHMDDTSFDFVDYEDTSDFHANRSNGESFNLHAPWTWDLTVILILAVFGIVANLALLAVISLNRHLRTVSNILVGNLAVADLIMFIFALPSDLSHWFIFNWPDNGLGNFLCKFSGGFWHLAQALCVASLTAVSIERYCTLRWQVRAKRTAVILSLVWIFALVCTVPVLVWAKVIRYDWSFSICHVLPRHILDDQILKGFVTAGFVFEYLIPLLVITWCYCGMGVILARGPPSSSAAVVRARRRLTIVVLILNISFAICWLPDHVRDLYFLYTSFKKVITISFETYVAFGEIAHVLVYINSCLNPVVVFAISAIHREPLVHFARACLSGVRQAPTTTGMDQNLDDPYARISEDVVISETDCADEKA